ncbi:MAG: hypothetical protein AAB152_02775 [Candidatus Coatesbacteria bacterium]
MPHLVSLNVLTLYPTELVALFLPVSPSTFYAFDLLLHLFLAAAAMRWWLRRQGVTEGGAFTGGLVYALGGHCLTLAAAGHPHWVRCLALMPLCFAALEGFPARGAVSGALAGLVISVALLGASLHFVILAVPVGVIWIVATGTAPLREKAVRIFCFGAVPLVLGAVIWIPGFEYFLESVRRVPAAGAGTSWALSVWDLPALLVPGLWGTPEAYWGPHLFRASGDYPGLLAVALAAIGLAARWRSEMRFAVLGTAGILLALGAATPAGAALDHLPVFAGLRVPLRWLSFTHLAVCVLAARGWDEVVAQRRSRVAVAGLGAVGLACAVGIALAQPVAARLERVPFVAGHMREGGVSRAGIATGVGTAARDGFVRGVVSAASLAFLAAGPGPLVWRAGQAWLVATADMLTAGSPYFQYADARAAATPDAVASELLRRIPPDSGRVATDEYFGLPNRRMGLGLEFTSGYHGLPLARYVKLHDAAAQTGSLAILGTLAVQCMVTGIRPLGAWPAVVGIDVAPGEREWVVGNPAAMPRAWLAAETVRVRDAEDAVAFMRRPGWTPAVVPVEAASGQTIPVGAGRVEGRNEITMLKGQDELEATLELARGGPVVFSEVWYPAWKAFVDGRRVAVWRACAALRAVEVPAGRHRVRMIYDSWSLKIGIWVSLLGWTVVVCAMRGRREA